MPASATARRRRPDRRRRPPRRHPRIRPTPWPGRRRRVRLCRPSAGDAGAAEVLATQVMTALAEPFTVAGTEVDPHRLRRHRPRPPRRSAPRTWSGTPTPRCTRAKDAGGGRYRLIDDELRARSSERLTLEADLRGALADGQLHVEYQPVVNLVTGQISGAEALLRWTHPRAARCRPMTFIPRRRGRGADRTDRPVRARAGVPADGGVERGGHRLGSRSTCPGCSCTTPGSSPRSRRAPPHRHRRRAAVPGAHRDHPDGRRDARLRCAARAQRRRRRPQRRRLRHRLLIAGLPQTLPRRRAQGRPQLRRQPRTEGQDQRWSPRWSPWATLSACTSSPRESRPTPRWRPCSPSAAGPRRATCSPGRCRLDEFTALLAAGLPNELRRAVASKA